MSPDTDIPAATLEFHDHTGVITLNRPDQRNALSRATADSIVTRLADARDAGARAIVLTGRGSVFCAGGDFDDLEAVVNNGAEEVTSAVYRHFQRLVLTLRDYPVPVIAAINGPAVGAGLDLATACDLRVACEQAWFSSAWIKLGLVTGMGATHQLTEIIGPSRAAELTLTGRRIGAHEALSWGLINRVVGSEEAVSASLSLAAEITAHLARAVAETVASLRRSRTVSLRAELRALADVQGQLLTGSAFANALVERHREPKDR